jgi:hypothetical protein
MGVMAEAKVQRSRYEQRSTRKEKEGTPPASISRRSSIEMKKTGLNVRKDQRWNRKSYIQTTANQAKRQTLGSPLFTQVTQK